MEVQAKQGGSHACFLRNSFRDDGLHDLLGFGARVVVELWVEERAAIREGEAERRKSEGCEDHKEAADRKSHVSCFFFFFFFLKCFLVMMED